MIQLSIFEANPLVRASDPDTSAQAAIRAVGFKAAHEARIFGAICDAGSRGATMHEIAAVTGLEPVQVGRRLGAMGERGLIYRIANYADDAGTVFLNFTARRGCCVWWKA